MTMSNPMTKQDSEPATFSLERRMLELRFRRVQLAAREFLTPGYVRIRLAGDDLHGFQSLGADDHIRVFFPSGDVGTVEELRASPSREYTPLEWGDGWLDLEFALHGDEGIAAPWAASAPLGALAGVGGPRGSRVMTGRPDAWFLAGDETAVPAIRRWAGLMDADAVGRIVIEVTDSAHELPVEAPSGVRVEYAHRGPRPSGAALIDRLDTLGPDDRPAGSVFGFVAAEAAVVKPGRALLLDRWGLDLDHIAVRGYWKRGETEYHAPH